MRTVLSSKIVSPFVLRVLAVSALGCGLAGAFGCGNASEPGAPGAAAAPASPEQTTAAETTVAAHAAGPGGIVFRALDGLTLTADQQAEVSALRANLRAQAAPVRTARAALVTELASQIRAGQIDQARLQPLADQVRAAASAMKPTVQAATTQVHDLLDATQRSTVAATFRDRAENAGEHQGRRHGGWHRMAKGLDLSAEQRETIHAAMKAAFASNHEAREARQGQMQAHLESLADAFEADTFDATTVTGSAAGAHAGRFAHMLAWVNAAVPVLSAAQRETLAQNLQSHAHTAVQTPVAAPAQAPAVAAAQAAE